MQYQDNFLEKMIGKEIQDVNVKPEYENGELVKLDIEVIPVQTAKFIDLNFKVLPTGVSFDENNKNK
jgi:hypothetical protein